MMDRCALILAFLSGDFLMHDHIEIVKGDGGHGNVNGMDINNVCVVGEFCNPWFEQLVGVECFQLNIDAERSG